MVEIRRLSIDELSPFLEFMEGPAFTGQPQWQGCYCQHYLNTTEQNQDPESKAHLNRERACDRVNAGTMQGYLAFDGNQAVGWMAANAASNFVQLPPAEPETARIICFVVQQEHQGRGVATAILDFALKDLPKQGFSAVEAAPLASDEHSATGYRGKLSMFLKAGFTAGPAIDEKHLIVFRQLTA